MPVSVVVGGQFGSEGKGKVALEIACRRKAAAVVRVGGTNSGHTALTPEGKLYALRQLPAAALAPDVLVVLPPGSLIDVEIFRREVADLGLTPSRLKLDPKATVITGRDKSAESEADLVERIGSTASGTGAALQRRMSRTSDARHVLAGHHPELGKFLCDTTSLLRALLADGKRVVIEGTQGFGLSILHGGFYPNATSRDTTAASFVAEAGLSPLDVDEVTMVLRTFPIRVAGNSGPLPNETTWSEVAKEAGLPADFHELTTATKKVRRVARFDPEIVRQAIAVNNPSDIALNHLDYVDPTISSNKCSEEARTFVQNIEELIGRPISWIGTGPASLVHRSMLNSQPNSPISREAVGESPKLEMMMPA